MPSQTSSVRMPQRILIVGGSGMLGQAMVRAFQSDGHTVTNQSRSPCDDATTDVRGDCLDGPQLLDDVDVVVFNACKVSYWPWKAGVLDQWNAAVDDWHQACIERGLPFHYIGSVGLRLIDEPTQLHPASAMCNDYFRHKHHVWQTLQGSAVGTYYEVGQVLPAVPSLQFVWCLTHVYSALNVAGWDGTLWLCTPRMVVDAVRHQINAPQVPHIAVRGRLLLNPRLLMQRSQVGWANADPLKLCHPPALHCHWQTAPVPDHLWYHPDNAVLWQRTEEHWDWIRSDRSPRTLRTLAALLHLATTGSDPAPHTPESRWLMLRAAVLPHARTLLLLAGGGAAAAVLVLALTFGQLSTVLMFVGSWIVMLSAALRVVSFGSIKTGISSQLRNRQSVV